MDQNFDIQNMNLDVGKGKDPMVNPLEDCIPPSAPKRKRRGDGPLVETEVRRSPRLIQINDGYKKHLHCSDKNCLPCNSAPPLIKNKFVKNLASSFLRFLKRTLM